MSASSKGYFRYFRYSLDEIMPHIGKDSKCLYVPQMKKLIRVKMNTRRILLFKEGTDCVCCGLRGEFFWLERSGCMPAHINLYGRNQHGHEVMLTADHIIPKSNGGLGVLENFQLLCVKCNLMKKNRFMTLDEMRRRKGIKPRRNHADSHPSEIVVRASG